MNTNLNKILEFKAVSKNFDGHTVLKEVSAEFERGKVYAIIGPNGAGKTTLLNVINGFLKPNKGKVFINGKDVTTEPVYSIARLGLGRLFQDIRNFQKMRVMDNLLISKKFEKEENPLFVLTKTAPNEHKRLVSIDEAKGYLKNFGISEIEKFYAEDLSYGQEKLLSLNRLIIGDFDIFLLDEPVAGVNPKIKGIIYKMIRELAKKGKLVIIVEHEMEAVRKVADFVYFISNGEIIKYGSPEHVLHDQVIIKEYIGIQPSENYILPKQAVVAEKKSVIFKTENIYAGYNKMEILHGVNIQIKEGEIVGLIGPNGAGKSTLLKILSGTLPVKRGQIVYEGKEMTRLSTKKRVENGIGYLIQGGEIYTDLTIDDNLTVSALNMGKKEIEEQKLQLYELFKDLRKKRNTRAGLLSGGESQMLALAMVLMKKPRKILLLDEPSAGLSPKLTKNLLQRMKDIRDIFSVAILLVEQRIDEVLELADRIYLMKEGKIIVPGISPHEIEQKMIEAIYMGNHNGIA